MHGWLTSDRWLHWLSGAIVGLLGLVLTSWLVVQQSASVREIGYGRFVQEARSFAEALGQRIVSNTEVVLAVRSMFKANPLMSRFDFERVVGEMDVGQRYPGVRALSFNRWVAGADKDIFEYRVRIDRSASPEGLPGFAIRPSGDRPEYFVTEYVWPLQSNQARLGEDVGAQTSTLEALKFARDSGRAVMSVPFDLSQAQEHPAAIVIHVPVFDPASGTLDRRFLGTASTTIRAYDMVKGLERQGLLQGITVAIADVGPGDGAGGESIDRPILAALDSAIPGAEPYVRLLPVHDRRWRLTFYPTRSFLSPYETRIPWLLGLGGALMSLLFATTVGLLVRQRTSAVARARGAEEARHESEQRFQALFNQTTVGVAQLDAHGRFIRVNQCYAEILGYTPQEMQGMHCQASIYPDDLDSYVEQLRRMQTGEVPECRLEKRYLHRKGHAVWVDLTTTPMWVPGAAPGHHIAVVQDITSRKLMESNLRANERRLRSILQRLPIGLCLIQADGHISFRNQRYVQICGYTEADTPTVNHWWKRAFPDVLERRAARSLWAHADLQAKDGEGVIPVMEYVITCADGSRLPVEISGVFLDGGRIITLQDLSQRKAAENEINSLAYYDPLTRLPNRRLLMDRLHQALAASARHHRSGALLLLDLDNFKTLNETRGHEQGDNLLLQVAERLRACVHEDDTVSRQGGDEFVVVLEDLGDDPQQAADRTEEVCQRILQVMREPYLIDAETHHSSLSMGVAIFSGMQDTADELLKRADLALYQAKDAGRDTLRFYDPKMQASVSARAAMELDMRTGLAEGQFELYYQPQIDRGRITGAEALLRWRHPQSGFISPAQFIPVAETTGLIFPLGEWVLQSACKTLSRWAHQPAFAQLSLAVNVSPRQFHQSGFVPQVLAALAGSGSEGQRLKLELTESLLLADVQDTVDKMGQLRAYGVGFSLDDFGTGYSSLSYLKRLPLDQLKIDQGFVRDVLTDPNDAAIARTVVALGTSLGLRVIAEGVETQAQREFLERHDCHAWQGYLFSAPVPVADFEAMVLRTNTQAEPVA
ncbi:EAL domain-containing protein [Acidovorax sp.]|uniref:bifunctional diguanylate cyclase/phosphodiesterase n=1 Tax=Acidovorax sp. TaxID=1872122 RepID=UPI00391F3E31